LVTGLLVLNLCLLVWYVFVGYQAWFHSDSAVKVLLAREIVATKDFFPDDWNYANGDLMVLFGHVFIIPLLSWMPAGFQVHAWSGALFAVLLLHGVWLVSGLGAASRIQRLLILAVVAGGLSGFMAENLYGQVSYGVAVVISCYLIHFAATYVRSTGRGAVGCALAVFVLALLAFRANPLRAIVFYGLPFMGAAVWFACRYGSDSGKRYVHLVVIFGLALVFGCALHLYTMSGVNNVMGAAAAGLLSFEHMSRNLALTPTGLLAILGGLPPGNELASVAGAYEAVRMVVALVLLVLIPVALFRALRQYGPGMQFMAAFATIAFVAVFIPQITTTIPDMRDPIQSARYLVPSVLLGLIVLLGLPLDWHRRRAFAFAVLAISLILATSAYPVFRHTGTDSRIASPAPADVAQHARVARHLADRGLVYGYASYWNAGVVSVFSNESSLVRQIQVVDGLPMPMRWLSSDRWYFPESWQGETFLLLTQAETEAIDWERMSAYGASPVSRQVADEFIIHVFDHNLAGRLPGWDIHYRDPLRIDVTRVSQSQAGRFVEDHRGEGPALLAESGETGMLHFGPYLNVASGRYRATFDVETACAQQECARLDVAGSRGQRVFGEVVLVRNGTPPVIEFNLRRRNRLEFRVEALGGGRVIFRGVSFQRLEQGR
tara:strand:+ start:4138 stop:6123 length:1986 start_codon:yes stop_codon:yes gene_type:complete